MNDLEKFLAFNEQLFEFIDFLDKHGYAFLIVKKPRQHCYTKMYNPNIKYDEQKTMYGATRCKELREERGLRICDVMKDLGVARAIVARMEDDSQVHTYKSMKRFADYYGCTVEELLK